MRRFMLFLVIVIAGLSACTGSKIEAGLARDTLFSVEKTRNGGYGIFLTHDESVVYCTGNEALGEQATSLLEHHGEVVIAFTHKKALNNTDGVFFGADKCQNYVDSSGGSFTEMILLDIRKVPSR